MHYATLARAPRAALLRQPATPLLNPSESIPDILQTLAPAPATRQNKANVIVNELSEDLVDLNSPEPEKSDPLNTFSQSYISVKHSNVDENI